MFNFSSASISHIASLSSNPIPQFTPIGSSFPNIQFNAIHQFHSITDINRFVIKLPEIPKLDISHCTPVFNKDLTVGPVYTYDLIKNDPIQLNALKSSHNAISEAVHDTDEPLHPLLYAPALKILNDTKKSIDKFCE